jgi:signal peptidase I
VTSPVVAPPDTVAIVDDPNGQNVAVLTPEPDGEVGDLLAPPRGIGSSIKEWGIVLTVALAVALIIRGFLIAPFFIPSTSMVNTLEVGDRILVNRLSYRLHDVNRGDVFVFEKPPGAAFGDEVEDLIKRAIGLPGDTLQFRDCHVYVNGQLLEEPYTDGQCTTAPNTVSDPEQDGTVIVPEGKYYAMGDNRGGSSDSRVWGFVDEEQIIGRAFVTIWPKGQWKWL